MRSAVDDRFYRDAGRRVMSCVRLWTSYQAGQGWVLEGFSEGSCGRFSPIERVSWKVPVEGFYQ